MVKTVTDWIRFARDCQIRREARQTELTQKWLLPAGAELLEKARAGRRMVDEAFWRSHQNPTRAQPMAEGETGPALYPVGYCQWIRNQVWARLSTDPLVKELRSQGLVWRKVYFILESRCFQNAIQCGDYLLDAAHNTLDARDEPVTFASLENLAWENLDDWPRYAAVAEAYYGSRLYPNYYFPLIFPLVPFFAVRSCGRIDLLCQQDNLFFLDMGENWRRVRRLLKDPFWMQRWLPADYETLLHNLCGKNDLAIFPLEFRKCTPGELSRSIDEWEQAGALPPEQLMATVKTFRQVAHVAAAKLRNAGLRPDPVRLAELRETGAIPQSASRETPFNDFI